MSKRFLVCLLIGVSGPALANTSSFTGFFIGAGVGYTVEDFKNKVDLTDPNNNNLNTVAMDGKTSLSGAAGELALGYGYGFSNCLYLGADIFGGLSSLKGEQSLNGKIGMIAPGGVAILNTTESFKMTNFFGVRARPGFLVGNRTLVHGTVGVTSSQFKASAKEDKTLDPDMRSASLKKRLTGFTFGGGIVTKMSARTSIGLEFTHTTYKTMRMKQFVDPANETEGIVNYSFKPGENKIMLKVAYHFGKAGSTTPTAA